MRTIGENRSRILGKFTANEMMKTFESEMFSMRAVMYPQSYLIVVGLVFVVLLLSEIPAIRRVFRLNLAESTKILE